MFGYLVLNDFKCNMYMCGVVYIYTHICLAIGFGGWKWGFF